MKMKILKQSFGILGNPIINYSLSCRDLDEKIDARYEATEWRGQLS